ncbi:retrovirus-related pol polyprotein from transposon TNT 1-94, partial [Tanacetum coccineum]
FCDADLEVAFRKSSCFVRDLQGNDLLTGIRGSDLYIISLQETTSSTPICFIMDQLCLSCEMSKAKRSSFKSKVVLSSKGRLNLLHMDLCGPMWVASINGKKYILVIVDDYSMIYLDSFSKIQGRDTKSTKRLSQDDSTKSSSLSDYYSN